MEIIILLPHATLKLYPCFSLGSIYISKKKSLPNSVFVCLFLSPCARPGQAGLRVATVLVSERGQDLVTPKLNYIIYYMIV